MRTTTRWIVLAVSVAAVCVLGGAPSAQAQEVQVTGPLANAPACHNCRLYRSGRFMIQPVAAFTLQDEFSRTMAFGAQLQFHFTDWLGLGAWGVFAPVHIDTGLTDEVALRGQSTPRNRLSLPSAQGFPDQIGTIQWVAAGQLTFIPLRGKLSLFQKLFIDSDFYIFAGAAAVGVEERADVEDPAICDSANPACLDTQFDRASRVAIAPTFGVGLTLYISQFLGLTLEWRGLPFAWNTSGTDEGGRDEDGNLEGGEFADGLINSDDRIFHFNHMFNIGLAFYLPTKVKVDD